MTPALRHTIWPAPAADPVAIHAGAPHEATVFASTLHLKISSALVAVTAAGRTVRLAVRPQAAEPVELAPRKTQCR